MTTIAILLGFGLMIILPCLVTLLRMRDHNIDEHSGAGAYADRVIETRDDAESGEPAMWPGHEDWDLGLQRAGTADADVMESWWPTGDSSRAGELMGDSCGRFEDAEQEALRTRVAAARAHADALAAVARVAEIKAQEAAHRAAMLEDQATKALNGTRRAA